MTEIGYALLTLASIPPYSAGYLAGIVVKAGAWIRAAFVAGYRKGRGQ
jgi:hypothetical protein